MALYNFVCEKCQTSVARMGSPKETRYHKACGGLLVRHATPPSTLIKESLDNGLMARKVERLHNVEELVHERATNDPRQERFKALKENL